MRAYHHSCLIILTLSICNGGEALRFPGFFIPEELQTIISVLYSHLPPTKIGSDQRFGVGFRLGRNADAQFLIELGPQSETEPLGDAGTGFNKRESRRQHYGRSAGKTDRRKKTTGNNTTTRPETRYNASEIDNNAPEIDNNAPEIDNNAPKIDNNASKIDNNASKIDNNLTADPLLRTAVTEKEQSITTSTVVKKKTKKRRRPKKIKQDNQIEEQSGPKSKEETVTKNVQKRQDVFINNFMSWLNRFNQPRNFV